MYGALRDTYSASPVCLLMSAGNKKPVIGTRFDSPDGTVGMFVLSHLCHCWPKIHQFLTLLSILRRWVSWEALTAFIMVSLSTNSFRKEHRVITVVISFCFIVILAVTSTDEIFKNNQWTNSYKKNESVIKFCKMVDRSLKLECTQGLSWKMLFIVVNVCKVFRW